MTNPVTNPDLASQFPWAQVVSFVVALLGVIASRLIDRYLPDPNGANPLPTPPPVAYSDVVTAPVQVVTLPSQLDTSRIEVVPYDQDDDGEPTGRHVKKDDLE